MTEDQNPRLVHEQIQYIEFPSADIGKARQFYSACFGWVFTDYGPDYTAFSGQYIDGGFCTGSPVPGTQRIILYTRDIDETKSKVIKAGGQIVKDIFSFPGGRRFHFTDPDGYELAAWTER